MWEALVKFQTNDRILHFGQPRVIRKKTHENFNTLSKLARLQPEFVRKLISFVIDRKALFYHWINERKIREIRDLYLKNIFVLYPKFYLYDRIGFNDSLRYADIAGDVAHLSMDLDYYERSDLRKY